jgi:hypothetical protein
MNNKISIETNKTDTYSIDYKKEEALLCPFENQSNWLIRIYPIETHLFIIIDVALITTLYLLIWQLLVLSYFRLKHFPDLTTSEPSLTVKEGDILVFFSTSNTINLRRTS